MDLLPDQLSFQPFLRLHLRFFLHGRVVMVALMIPFLYYHWSSIERTSSLGGSVVCRGSEVGNGLYHYTSTDRGEVCRAEGCLNL